MAADDIPQGYHRHPNGGGMVEDTATVADTVFVGPEAWVNGRAKVTGHVRIIDEGVVGNAAQDDVRRAKRVIRAASKYRIRK